MAIEADGEGSQSKPNDKVNSDAEAKIRFYYNNVTKDYIIYAPSNKTIIHKSKMLYNHGKMPIEVCQHYTDIKSIYGIGIPKKIAYLK
jgi:DNA gyrase/topoisomerase IV subunit B